MKRTVAAVMLFAMAEDCRPAEAGAELTEEVLAARRERMVRDQIAARGVSNARVLAALRRVPRHRFVPTDRVDDAYGDFPLPIGHDQTISQPYIVALMSELAAVKPGDRVLEIGTGSGFQAAVLAELGAQVYSIEISPPLCLSASARLQQIGSVGVRVRCGDGYRGWPERAPFDAVVVTAAPRDIPKPLLEQLRDGGRLVIPIGVLNQDLLRVTRVGDGYTRENVIPVRFVPMTGEAERARPGAVEPATAGSGR
jgi:protein-L-isoaspartate(D-aspartate) O-methyltransferase